MIEKVMEILRLFYEHNYSCRRICIATGIPKSTVSNYLKRFQDTGLSWPLQGIDEYKLESLLCRPGMKALSLKPLPDFSKFPTELKRKGVTLNILWLEYKENHPDGYEYSQFCELYRQWEKAHDVYMRQNHKAGEKMFVDFAGQTMPITNKETGQIWNAKLFVAVLGASNYPFTKVVDSERMENWIRCHIAAFEYFGGVTEIIVPDNLKSGVDKPSRYEPTINRTYLEMAKHYGTVIIPARVRHPQDKSPAENAVKVTTSWVLAKLRNRTFFSVEEANAAVKEELESVSVRKFKKLPTNRRELYETLDKPALRPLPSTRFEYAEWEKQKVHKDYHVEIRDHFYSVPYQLVNQKVEARITHDIIEIIHRGKRVATHKRSFEARKTTTIFEHMPKSHQAQASWGWSTALANAKAIGPNTVELFRKMREESRHPNLSLQQCAGVLKLHKEFGTERLETAAAKALQIQSFKYSSIRSILKNNIDQKPAKQKTEGAPKMRHENVRGAKYYG